MPGLGIERVAADEIKPRGYHPLADGTDPAQLRRTLAEVRARISDAVQAMPSHAAFLAGGTRSGQPQTASADGGWSG
ncbi:MAG: hypothetical protein M3N07_09470 [Pseudomonadota bacterium]|nr:hypothetical protein [Pseudomonadota bacterium]